MDIRLTVECADEHREVRAPVDNGRLRGWMPGLRSTLPGPRSMIWIRHSHVPDPPNWPSCSRPAGRIGPTGARLSLRPSWRTSFRPASRSIWEACPRRFRKQRHPSQSRATEGQAIRTFRDLLTHPQPPVTLLQVTKQFAKAMVCSPESPVPAEIGRVLYLAAILAALLRCGQRITELDTAALREGIDWALVQPWLDPALRPLFEAGRGHFPD